MGFLKVIFFWGAAFFVVVASFLYIFEFMTNILLAKECSETASKWTFFYCLVAIVFLFAIDRNKGFSEYHSKIKPLNFLLVLTPVFTGMVDVFKPSIVQFIVSEDFTWIGSAVICLLCTGILLGAIVAIRKGLDALGW